MAAENTTGFSIDGTVYEVPAIDSLTMSERRVMFELGGVAQEDFVRTEDETEEEFEARSVRLIRNPGLMEALMHIAYQRGNPKLSRGKVQAVIDGTTYLSAVESLAGDEEPEEDEVPLASTTEPEQSSPNGSVDNESTTVPSSVPGGMSSENASAAPASTPTTITTLRSGTSST